MNLRYFISYGAYKKVKETLQNWKSHYNSHGCNNLIMSWNAVNREWAIDIKAFSINLWACALTPNNFPCFIFCKIWQKYGVLFTCQEMCLIDNLFNYSACINSSPVHPRYMKMISKAYSTWQHQFIVPFALPFLRSLNVSGEFFLVLHFLVYTHQQYSDLMCCALDG